MKGDERTATRRQSFGGVVMFLGIGLIGLVLLDAAYGLPWTLPPTWYVHRTVWGAIGLGACAAGWYLQRGGEEGRAGWNPGAGRRFRKLVVYSRTDCHLCDDAKAVLAGYLEYLPDIEEADIDLDPELQSRFATSIPVVEIDGRVYFHGRVDEILLRRLIESTPPQAG